MWLDVTMLKRVSTGYYLLFFLMVSLPAANAQHKQHVATEIWPELQAEYVFKSTSFFYFRHQYRYTTNSDYKGLNSFVLNNQLKRIQFRLGYEQALTNTWGLGGSQMFSFEPGRKLYFTDVYLRHLSFLPGLQVIKRVMVDYLLYTNAASIGRLRPRVDLDKPIKIRNFTLRLRAGYEVFLYTDFKTGKPYSARVIDRTRLRGEVVLQPNPHLTFTPFFTKQTDYTRLPNKESNQSTTVTFGENRNSITPIWGVEFRYTFYQGKKPFPRVIAPVQQD
ncbi:DUF2490 domain-containing protein [Adhaeribacter radiodurans]|uniref:DUF2490 domain-containing protein n=1 Tax=Adhaeribacter radiodurans TaxID=2745197 RepID=A0A7L7LBM4_9BACT|nr:DUF2490 domain-containing protein [Adhaeribacter radiodurans]QMU30231.1 DUF2490 domain-containing protein [Adhaeribacter radiodurans]